MNRQVIIPVELDPASLSLPGPGFLPVKLDGETMGTSWSAKYYGPTTLGHAQVRQALENVFSRVITDFSNWDDSSFISRLNRAPEGSCHTLSSSQRHILTMAADLSSVTQGAFNPCLGRYTSNLAFEVADNAFQDFAAPSAGDLEKALDRQKNTLVQSGNMQLDLSAIAKGYAVDQMAYCLKAFGIDSYLVEIGGEFVGQGIKPDGTPWWVEIETNTSKSQYTAALCGLAVATSALTERRYKLHGKAFHHIAGANGDLTSVTVFAPSCAEADGWATALLASGKDIAQPLANRHRLAALFIDRDGTASHSTALTGMLQ